MTHIVRRHIATALLLLLPALVFAFVFLLYPLLNGVYLSFTNASALRPTHRFVGLSNYEFLLGSPEFYVVIGNSIVLVGGAIALSMVVGLGLAVLLNQRLPGTSLIRAGVFQIWIVPWISVAILWGWIFNADYGIVNFLLSDLNIIDQPVSWFSGSNTARLVILLGFAWRRGGRWRKMKATPLPSLARSRRGWPAI